MEQAAVSLRENRPSAGVNSYKLRAGHIEELEEQSTAFLSDAIELLEEEKSNETVLDLLNAADTQLAAIQDLLIQEEHTEIADRTGRVRKEIDAAKGMLLYSESLGGRR